MHRLGQLVYVVNGLHRGSFVGLASLVSSFETRLCHQPCHCHAIMPQMETCRVSTFRAPPACAVPAGRAGPPARFRVVPVISGVGVARPHHGPVSAVKGYWIWPCFRSGDDFQAYTTGLGMFWADLSIAGVSTRMRDPPGHTTSYSPWYESIRTTGNPIWARIGSDCAIWLYRWVPIWMPGGTYVMTA